MKNETFSKFSSNLQETYILRLFIIFKQLILIAKPKRVKDSNNRIWKS
jgi:hypothetical protein